MPRGCGRVVVEGGPRQEVTDLFSHFPIRLHVIHQPSFDGAVLYALGYGGGLLHGDEVLLELTLKRGAALMYLTRGGLKVYGAASSKTLRSSATHAAPLASPSAALHHPCTTAAALFASVDADYAESTKQITHYEIDRDAFVLHLPDATTCYADAAFYNETVLTLADESSACLYLDWYTSGRAQYDERWAAAWWQSSFTVLLRSSRHAVDTDNGASTPPQRVVLRDAWSQTKEEASFGCALFETYASLFLCGAPTRALRNRLAEAQRQRQIGLPHTALEDRRLIWTYHHVRRHGIEGSLVKVAAREHCEVQRWLRSHLLAPESQLPYVHLAFR